MSTIAASTTLKYAKNQGEGKFEILLHGIFGEEINGEAIAQEIKFLNDIGATEITERINSPGGSVISGYSVVAANIASKAKIITINEGVAMSMGAVILATGNERKALDFSVAMIHNILLNGVSLNEVKDKKKKEDLTKINDSLKTILLNNTGRNDEELSDLMARETHFTSKEQEEFGLIDEIIPTKRLDKEKLQAMSAMQIYNVVNEKLYTKMDLSRITNHFGLVSDANESSIMEAIENEAKKHKLVLDNLNDQNKSLTNELEEVNKKLESLQNVSRKIAVDRAIETGKFKEEQRDFLDNEAKRDLTGFNRWVEAIPEPYNSARSEINNGKQPANTDDRKNWTYDEWVQKDPKGFNKLQEENPQKFEEILNKADQEATA
jgi:ATP-dependent Clp endopeptidase proteolytic subunit ClpP